MKRLLFIFSLWFSTLLCYGQEPYDEKIWAMPNSLPEFPGGHDSLLSYIDENLIYPMEFLELVLSKEVKENKVYLELTIDQDGFVRRTSILRDIIDCVSCRKEATSVMKSSPQWKPGYITLETRDKAREEYYQSLLSPSDIWMLSTEWMESQDIVVHDSLQPKNLENKKDTIIEESPINTQQKDSLLVVKSSTTILIRFKLEKLPELPYGIDSLTNYINTNLVYPERAVNERTQGKVDVKLMFDDTGEIKDVLLLQGMENCPECDEEALILLQNMPKDLMRANDSPNSPKPFFFNTFIEFRLE